MPITIAIKNQGPTSTIQESSGSTPITIQERTGPPNINYNDIHTQQLTFKEDVNDESEFDFEQRLSCVTDDDCEKAYIKVRPQNYTSQYKPVCVNGFCKLKNK